jgi:hypothetical protein
MKHLPQMLEAAGVKPMFRSSIAVLLSVEDVEGVLLTRLYVVFDVESATKGREPIRIDDHFLKGNPNRNAFRKMLLADIKPFIKTLGERIDIVHEGTDGLIIFTSVPRDEGVAEVHGDAPENAPGNPNTDLN